jgi:methylglutaconyl-CoA hydratase
MSELTSEIKNDVLYLALNRPEKRNALNPSLVLELSEAFQTAQNGGSVKAALITGNGDDFCSGADLESLRQISINSRDENLEDARMLGRLFSQIRALDFPVIAKVRGRALAGGCGLATACDLVVCSESAEFGYPEVHLGFVPAMVAAILRRKTSEKVAFELLTRGARFSAQEAKEFGLVNRVWGEADLDRETEALLDSYRKLSRSAVTMTKRLLYSQDGLSFEEAIEAGAQVNADARMTKDCRDGIERFLSK